MNASFCSTPGAARSPRRTRPAAPRPTTADVKSRAAIEPPAGPSATCTSSRVPWPRRPRRAGRAGPRRPAPPRTRPRDMPQSHKRPAMTAHLPCIAQARTGAAFASRNSASCVPGLGDERTAARSPVTEGALLEAAVAGRAHLVQDPAVQVQRRQGGKPAVLVQQAHVALHGKVELFGAPRKRLPCRAKRRVHPMLGQLAQRIARFFQHARRQIHPTAAPVLPHVAQDVGQLHGHAQRHGVLAQPLRQRGTHVQERQQHEPDRPCHVVGRTLPGRPRWTAAGTAGRDAALPEGRRTAGASMSKFSNTTARARHSGSSGTLPARKRSSAPCNAASPALLASRSTQSSADAAERVQRVHARALVRGKQGERPVEAVRVAPDDLFAPREVVGALGEPVPRRHRAPPACVRSSRSSRISSCTASLALKSTMGTPAPGCVLLPQKYRRSHPAALLCGRQ